MFPGTTLIANSGGLLTFRVLKGEMDIGKAFDSMHKQTASLGIEYFTISQPTLEQVTSPHFHPTLCAFSNLSSTLIARCSLNPSYLLTVHVSP
jgi:hypothetical protein